MQDVGINVKGESKELLRYYTIKKSVLILFYPIVLA